LELAILNLAVNARDAMPDGGRLTISGVIEEIAANAVVGLVAGRYIRLSVSDTGTGMNAETLHRATEPFFSTKGLGKGTGLGLSAVQGLAMQSGGGFMLASEIGRGTTAFLWLPLATEAAELAETEEIGIAAAPRQACVLLVDDEELVRETAALELRELGYQVIEANSAAAALEQISQGLRPDLLVTDHIMPGGTGAQLAHELRRIMRSLPVLMITGYAGSNPELLKGFDVIAKPYRLNDLSTRVAELVARKRESQSDIVP
jgi:CheY-like chemotaxis protein